MKKYKNKYRIPSARAALWNYSNNGAYFITICTKNRRHFFGECSKGKMTLSTMGAIVQGFWFEIPKHFPFVQLGEFVVMPNHIHGVLILNKTNHVPVETLHCNDSTSDMVWPQEAVWPTELVEPLSIVVDPFQYDLPTQPPPRNEYFSKISPPPGSAPVIVRSYKSVCTYHINKIFPDKNFGWQTRFWDNIIRDDMSFNRISNYIINNPRNWDKDCFFDNI
jgi:REP element-mobilizing transposase RayT